MVGSLDVHFDDAGLITSCQGNATLLLVNSFKRKDTNGNKVEVDAAARDEIEAIINGLDNVEIVPEDPGTLAALQVYQEQVDALKFQVVGQAAVDLGHVRIPGQYYLGNSGADFPRGSEIAPLFARQYRLPGR